MMMMMRMLISVGNQRNQCKHLASVKEMKARQSAQQYNHTNPVNNSLINQIVFNRESSNGMLAPKKCIFGKYCVTLTMTLKMSVSHGQDNKQL